MTVANTYNYTKPSLIHYGNYEFVTKDGLIYEVRFGRMEHDCFHVTVSFGIKGEKSDDDYRNTNVGEPFKIISTVKEIILDYLAQKPNVKKIEFTGIENDVEEGISDYNVNGLNESENIRTRWYKRCFRSVNNWKLEQDCNKILAVRCN